MHDLRSSAWRGAGVLMLAAARTEQGYHRVAELAGSDDLPLPTLMRTAIDLAWGVSARYIGAVRTDLNGIVY